MNINSKQYISNNKDKRSYTTIFKHYYNSTEKRVGKEGDIYTLLEISSEKGVNTERITKFVWDSIVDGYLYSSSSTTNESLKEAVKKGVEKVKELIRNDKELEETGVDVNFTIILVKNEGTYVGVFGESDIYVFKKGSVVSISDILKEKKANTAGVALSKEDVLMISSVGLLSGRFRKFSELKKKGEFEKVLNHMGSNLVGTESLLYFSQGIKKEINKKSVLEKKLLNKERKEVKKDIRKGESDTVNEGEEKKSLSTVENIKEGAEKLLAPIARIEKIKKPKGQSTIQDLTAKIRFRERVLKLRKIWESVWAKILPFTRKVSSFLKERWELLKEAIVKSVGRKRWYKRIASRWSQIRVKKRRSRGVQGMKIDGYKEKSLKSKRFKLLAMVIVVIVLLVLGVNFTIRMREAREISNLAQESFVQVEDLLEKVEDNFAADRTSAETYLFQAERALEEVPEGLGQGDMERYDELAKRILDLGDNLYRRVGVVEDDFKLSSFLNSRLAFGEGSDVVDMTIYKDRFESEYLFVTDVGRKSVYRVSLFDKSVRALPDDGGLVTEPAFIYVGNKGVYVYDEKEGVLKAPFDDEGWFTSFVSLSGLGISEIRSSDIATMTVWTPTDNVYFLSRDRKAFLRSTAVYDDRYGLPYEYFGHEKMGVATDMVADISIYMTLPEDPYILRYNYSFLEGKYVEAPLGVVGFDGDYGELTKAFTGPDLTYPLYVFDAEGRRFLQLQKPIESGVDMRHPNQVSLLNQYIYRGERDSVWKNVKNFVVDANEVDMYILDGSEIWKLVL